MKATIIGYGNIAPYYKRSLESFGWEVSVCDTNSDVLNDFTNKVYHSHTDPEILDSDIIVIATPPFTHLELLKYFTDRNKNVILEKPAVISEEELNEFKNIYQEKSKFIYLAYHCAFNPVVIELKVLIFKFKPMDIFVQYSENIIRYHNNHDIWLYKKNLSGGGCLIDSGINILSVLYVFIPQLFPTLVNLQNRFSEVEDLAKVNLKTENNINVEISMDWNSENEVRKFILKNEDNELSFNLSNNEIILNGEILPISQKAITKLDMQAEYDNLIADSTKYFNNGKTDLNFDIILPLKTIFDIYNF